QRHGSRGAVAAVPAVAARFASLPSREHHGGMTPLLVGAGAGFCGDRLDAAGPAGAALAASGQPAAPIFATLPARTLALAQLQRRADPQAGYEPLLAEMLAPVLGKCLRHRIRIVSNFGAANPHGAAQRILRLARESGLPPPRIAVVEGDDVSGERFRPL